MFDFYLILNTERLCHCAMCSADGDCIFLVAYGSESLVMLVINSMTSVKSVLLLMVIVAMVTEVENIDGVKEHPCPELPAHCLKTIQSGLCGSVWYGVVWCGMVWYRVVSCVMVWHGMVWCGVV